MVGIYKIENKMNKKVYIGKSIDILNRWQEHMEQGEKATLLEDEFHFELAQNPDFFIFSILEICLESELSEKEAFYIKKYKSVETGYNKINASNEKRTDKIVAKTNKDIVNRLNELMGKPLFVEDKEKLAIFMGYRDKKGNLLSWRTVKKHLIENGLEVYETKRKVNGKMRNCSIISICYNY